MPRCPQGPPRHLSRPAGSLQGEHHQTVARIKPYSRQGEQEEGRLSGSRPAPSGIHRGTHLGAAVPHGCKTSRPSQFMGGGGERSLRWGPSESWGQPRERGPSQQAQNPIFGPVTIHGRMATPTGPKKVATCFEFLGRCTHLDAQPLTPGRNMSDF